MSYKCASCGSKWKSKVMLSREGLCIECTIQEEEINLPFFKR